MNVFAAPLPDREDPELAVAVAWVSSALRNDNNDARGRWAVMTPNARIVASRIKSALWTAGVRGPIPSSPANVVAALAELGWRA